MLTDVATVEAVELYLREEAGLAADIGIVACWWRPDGSLELILTTAWVWVLSRRIVWDALASEVARRRRAGE